MKEGITIQDLATKLVEIEQSKLDLVVPTRSMEMENGTLMLRTEEANIPKELSLNNWSHAQVSQYTDVPKAYYDRLRVENPMLLSSCVNHGFFTAVQCAKLGNESRMLRTNKGIVRGFLSSRYRRLDSHDLLETCLPLLMEHQFVVKSCQLTEQKMYLKVVTDRIQGEVVPGQVVQYGLVISSSDVGAGSVRVEPLIYELICKNGMISNTNIRKYHIGRNQGADNIEELLTDETKKLNDKAFWATIHDLVKGSMEKAHFQREIALLQEARQVPITNMRLDKVVDLTMKEFGVSNRKHKDSILNYLASGADGRGLNKWGLANAFTWAAQAEDAEYEEATNLERVGGKIIAMNKSKWESVAGS